MAGENHDQLRGFVGCLTWIALPSAGLAIGWSVAGMWVGLACMFALGIVGFWILTWLTREQGAAFFGCATICMLVATALICVVVREIS